MPDGRIDPKAFRRVIGSLLERAAAAGRPVRAYGEMVALLWEAGDVLAAIELEELWNDIARDHDFGLLCGYRSASVAGDHHDAARQRVCCLHSAVLEPRPSEGAERREVSARFGADKDAPRAAGASWQRRCVPGAITGCRRTGRSS